MRPVARPRHQAVLGAGDIVQVAGDQPAAGDQGQQEQQGGQGAGARGRVRFGHGGVAGAKGSRWVHDKLISFIQRNYQADAQVRWFFQNGPQRVYVELEAAPWVWRLGGEPQAPLDKAKALIKEAGVDPASLGELTFLTYYGDQLTKDMLAVIAEQLAAVGFKTKLRFVDTPTFNTEFYNADPKWAFALSLIHISAPTRPY